MTLLVVKICGVRTPEGAEAVRDSGAELAGFNFVAHSRRRIDPAGAKKLIALLGNVTCVGVFADESAPRIEEIARDVGLTWIQLHGKEPPELCRDLKKRFKIIKAISIAAPPPDEALLAAYEPHIESFLFDGPRAGSGTPFAWETLERSITTRSYFIAGGLTPKNVAEAIRTARPHGVDTASGVEIAGAQDPARIQAFVREARRGE